MATYTLTKSFNNIAALHQRGTKQIDPADPLYLNVVLLAADGTELEVTPRGQRLWRIVTGTWAFTLDPGILTPGESYTVSWRYAMAPGIDNASTDSFVWQPVPVLPHEPDTCIVSGTLKDVHAIPVNDAKLIVEQYRDMVTQTKRVYQQTTETDVFGHWWIELPHDAVVRFVFGDVAKVVRVPQLASATLASIAPLQLSDIVRVDAFGYPLPGSAPIPPGL